MADKDKSEKTPLEHVLIVISSLVTIFEVINLFTSGNAVFENQFATTTFVIIVLAIAVGICLIILFRRKSPRRYYYDKSRRRLAKIALSLSSISIILLIVLGYIYRPCLVLGHDFEQGKFGILVADFTDGANSLASRNGKEVGLDIFDAINDNLFYSPRMKSKVETSEICVIRNEKEAVRAGKSSGASLVIWGRVFEKRIKPELTLVGTSNWSPNIDMREIISPVFAEDVESDDLETFSFRIEALTNFVLGFVYLDTASNSKDYELAVQEFTAGISVILSDLKTTDCLLIEQRAAKRLLAILYTGKGRGHEVLNQMDEATNDYQKALACDDEYSAPYIGLGNLQYTLGNYDRAKSYYQNALNLQESSSAHYSLGNVLYYLGNYEESIVHYEKSIAITEAHGYNAADIRLLLGETYQELGAYQLAHEQFYFVSNSKLATSTQKSKAQKMLSTTIVYLTRTPIATQTSAIAMSSEPRPTAAPHLTRVPRPTATFPPCETPFAPQLTLNRLRQNADLTWISIPNAESYEVFRSINEGSYSLLGRTNETNMKDSLQNNATYSYYAVAINACGQSNPSNIVNISR